MKLRSALIIFSLLVAATINQAAGQLTASTAFTSAPHSVLPMLDNNTRLDMLDYFNNGLSTSSVNSMNGHSRITALTDQAMTIAMTEATTYQIAVLPSGNTSLIALITTVATPAPDSKMTIYSSDWATNITTKVFSKPTLNDWLTTEGRKNADEVEMMVPFLLISYNYDPNTQTLQMTNNSKEFLSQEVYELVEPYLQTSLTYRFDGKKFTIAK